MKKIFEKIFINLAEWLFYFLLFMLPWQTRLIIEEGVLNGGHWEWGTYSLYAVDIVFILLVIMFCLGKLISKKFQIPNDKSQINLKSQISNQKDGLMVAKKKFPLPGKMMFLVLLFLIFAFVSIFWAEDKGLAFYWWLRILEGVILFIFIQKINFNIIKAGWALVLAGLAQVGLAGWQFINQKVFSSKWLGIAAQNTFQAGTSVVETAEGRILRLYGGFSHPNIFAGFLVFLIFVLFVLYFSTNKFWQKSLILFFSSLMTITLYFTYSRAAWIALLVNLIFLAVYIFKKAPKNFRRTFFDFFGLVLIIFIMFSGLTARDFIVRVEANGRLEDISINERILNLEQGQTLAKENFLFGVGPGNYTWQLFKKYPNLKSWDYQPTANIYLLILVEFGFIGLLLFLAMALFIFLRLGYNIYAPMLLSLLTLGLFDHWLFSLSFGILLFWLALGSAWKRCRIHELTGREEFF